MVNKCGHCGNPVAGHRQKYGSDPGKGNCTQPPFIPATPSTSQGDHNVNVSDATVISSNSVMTTSPTVMTTSPPIVTTSSIPVSSSVLSTPDRPSVNVSNGELDTGVVMTNAGLEKVLTKKCELLAKQVREAEAEAESKLLLNVRKLQEKQAELQQRLATAQSYQPSTPLSVPDPPANLRVVPQTQVTWSAPNPFITPASSSAFGANALIQPAARTMMQQSTAPPTASFPSLTTWSSVPDLQSVNPAGASLSTAHAPQASLAPPTWTSAPDLQSATPLSNPVPSAHAQSMMQQQGYGTAHAHQVAQLQTNVNNLGNMAAISNFNPFVSAEDILSQNPIAKAMLNMQNEAREEAAQLGKYIPELYSLKYEKIERLRANMSYHEFIQMYTRMLVHMLEKDPHLVPDRIIFLKNIAAKAARYKWPEVRNCYAVAINQIKYQGRKWAQDLSDITDDQLPPSSYIPPRHGGASGNHQGPQRFGTVSKAPCNDYNERTCTRPVCKFDHKCARCLSYDHPASACMALLPVHNRNQAATS